MGRADRPQGLLKRTGSNANVFPFVQDGNYYSQKGLYYSRKNNISRALLFLQKAIEAEPENSRNHFNLACLLSKTDRLQEANQIFSYLVSKLDPEMTECYFFMAVNHGLLGELSAARSCLLKYLQVSPPGEMAAEAEDLLLAIEEDEAEENSDSSLSPVENEELYSLVESLNELQFKDRLLADESFCQILKKGLYQGRDLLKELIIRLCGSSCSSEALDILIEFVANPWINERLRQVALLEIKKADPSATCRIYREGRFLDINLHDYPLPAPVWESKWQQVLECTFSNMKRSDYYSEEFYEDAEAIWIDYINRVYPDGPRVDNPHTWAAGLEYCLGRFHFLGLTQKELAAEYGISTASVQRKYMEINSILQIDQRAYRNILSMLNYREGEFY